MVGDGRKTIASIIMAIVIGLVLDYVTGNIIVPAIIVTIIVSIQKQKLKKAIGYAITVNIAWLTIAYIQLMAREGAAKMIGLLGNIAGIKTPMLYTLTYIILITTALPTATATHYWRKTIETKKVERKTK